MIQNFKSPESDHFIILGKILLVHSYFSLYSVELFIQFLLLRKFGKTDYHNVGLCELTPSLFLCHFHSFVPYSGLLLKCHPYFNNMTTCSV